MAHKLTRTDQKLIADALKSNGGGIDEARYAGATVQRLLKDGLVQWKPNQHKSKHYSLLLTLTELGKTVAFK